MTPTSSTDRAASPPASSAVTRLRCALLVTALSALCACSRAPDGFEAVSSPGSTAGSDCPALTGTFDLSGTPAGDALVLPTTPSLRGLPVVLTFTQESGSTAAWWLVPRATLLAFARTVSDTDPERYVRWREQMLTKKSPATDQMADLDAYLAAFTGLGPPGPLHQRLPAAQCRDNWLLVSDAVGWATIDDEKYWMRHETWLAHDKTGALLAKHLSYRFGTIPLPRALRRIRIANYQRYEALPPEPATPLTATELPASTRAPSYRALTCAERSQRVARLSERMTARISPAMKLTQFTPQPAVPNGADGECADTIIDIEITGSDPHMLAYVDDWLRKEDGVASMTLLPVERSPVDPPRRRFRVEFR